MYGSYKPFSDIKSLQFESGYSHYGTMSGTQAIAKLNDWVIICAPMHGLEIYVWWCHPVMYVVVSPYPLVRKGMGKRNMGVS